MLQSRLKVSTEKASQLLWKLKSIGIVDWETNEPNFNNKEELNECMDLDDYVLRWMELPDEQTDERRRFLNWLKFEEDVEKKVKDNVSERRKYNGKNILILAEKVIDSEACDINLLAKYLTDIFLSEGEDADEIHDIVEDIAKECHKSLADAGIIDPSTERVQIPKGSHALLDNYLEYSSEHSSNERTKHLYIRHVEMDNKNRVITFYNDPKEMIPNNEANLFNTSRLERGIVQLGLKGLGIVLRSDTHNKFFDIRDGKYDFFLRKNRITLMWNTNDITERIELHFEFSPFILDELDLSFSQIVGPITDLVEKTENYTRFNK